MEFPQYAIPHLFGNGIGDARPDIECPLAVITILARSDSRSVDHGVRHTLLAEQQFRIGINTVKEVVTGA